MCTIATAGPCTCLKNPGYVYATPHYVCHFEGHLTPLLPELLTVPLSSKYRNYSQKSIGSRGLICRLSARYMWQPHDVSSGKTCTCAFLGRLLSLWCIYFLIFWVWKILITLASVQPFHLLDRIVIESGQGWTFVTNWILWRKLAIHCVSHNVNHSGNFDVVFFWMAF